MNQFQKNVDEWIKQINHQLAEVDTVTKQVEENSDNIDYNYELIKSLRKEVKELNHYVEMMMMVQLATCKITKGNRAIR